MTTRESYSDEGYVSIGYDTWVSMMEMGFAPQYRLSPTRNWLTPGFSPDGYEFDSAANFRATKEDHKAWLDKSFEDAEEVVCSTGGSLSPTPLKSRPDLLPSEAVLAAGRVLAFGLVKHPDEKWKTLSVGEHRAAALRHLFQGGTDSESGESHLAHALCRIAFAIARGEK